MLSFLKECKIVPVEDSVAASKATTVGEIVDTAGFGAACFVYKLGTVVDLAEITLKIDSGTDATLTDAAELVGATAGIAAADTSSEQVLVVDVLRCKERYLRPTITTATQNVEIDSAFCLLYNPELMPVTQPDAIIDSALVVSPAEA